MDYHELDITARVEGQSALERRLAALMRQAEAARERNESGETPHGLSKSIRKTRYMLDQAVSAEGRPSTKDGDQNLSSHVEQQPEGSSAPSGKPAENSDGIRKFGEGVEMQRPIRRGTVQFNDEKGRSRIAYKIYEGSIVRRDENGAPIVSPDTSFVAVATNERFQTDRYNPLTLFPSFHEASLSGSRGVYDECMARQRGEDSSN